MNEELAELLRLVMQTCGKLGWQAAMMGLPLEKAMHQIAYGPEADTLLRSIAPGIVRIVKDLP